MKWFLVCLALAGCAKAGKGNSIIGGITDAGPGPDAREFPEPDASPIDAPPQQVTLSQTTSGVIVDGNTFSCRTDISAQNSYYRVFVPADDNITTMLHVTEVEFGIELADAGPSATKQPAKVVVGTYGATPGGTTLDPAQIRVISSVNIQIPDGIGTRMSVPITADIPPNTNLLVELVVPDGSAAQSVFVIGSNAQGERRPGYTSAPDCSLTNPTTMKSIATQIMSDDADVILTVTGTR